MTDQYIAIIGLIISVAIGSISIWVGIGQLLVSTYPLWLERKNNRILQEKLSRGLYDQYTIKQAVLHYVRPKCLTIDPTQELNPQHPTLAFREDLFEKVTNFLDLRDSSQRHLIVLSDTGMGKTSFVLNYYAYNLRRPKNQRHKIVLIPLSVKNADSLIAEIPDQDEKVIFLDGFDEDSQAIANHRSRMVEILELCQKYEKVVITCRSQFFTKDEDIPKYTGLAQLGPRGAGKEYFLEFSKVYLAPFDDEQIKQYLKKRYPLGQYRKRKQAFLIVSKVKSLSVRPMLLSYIPELIETNSNIRYSFQIYDQLIDAWIRRESGWSPPQSLREFSEHLAVEIHVNREKRGTERIGYEELIELAKIWGIDLDKWQISSRSLLNRDSEGNYKFAHRSFMEYLFIVRLLKNDSNCFNVKLTEQMKGFLLEKYSTKLPLIQSSLGLLYKTDVFVMNFLARDDNALLTTRIGLMPPIELELLIAFWKNNRPKEIMNAKDIVKTKIKSLTNIVQHYHEKGIETDRTGSTPDTFIVTDSYTVQTILIDLDGRPTEYEFDVDKDLFEERLLPWVQGRSRLIMSEEKVRPDKHTFEWRTIHTLTKEIRISEPDIHRFIGRFTLSAFRTLMTINASEEIHIEPVLPALNELNIFLKRDAFGSV